MAIPTQIRKEDMRNDAAYAPFNFVPLPNTIVPAQGLPDHDRFYDDRHSGYFTVTLKTLSPTYVRSGLENGPSENVDTEYARSQKEKLGKNDGVKFRDLTKNKADFFHVESVTQPVIPGSSLRGMIRNLLEIGTFSKLTQLSDSKFFYRAPDRADYRNIMVRQVKNQRIPRPDSFTATLFDSRVRAGILKYQDGKWHIEECWIARAEIPNRNGSIGVASLFGLTDPTELYEVDGRPNISGQNNQNPNQVPRAIYQHRQIWCNVGDFELQPFPAQPKRNGYGNRHGDLYLKFRKAENLSLSNQPGKLQGILVLTGHMEYKHLAHIFVEPSDGKVTYPVSEQIVEQFNSDEQITQWQINAFSGGRVKKDDPVFFVLDDTDKSVRFFGRAQLFRLPYQNTTLSLIPKKLRNPDITDFAISIFGHVNTDKEISKKHRQGTKKRAYSGRVFVADAVLAKEQKSPIWLVKQQDEALVPNILGSPKPTAFAHYLVQSSDDSRDLFHYDSNVHEGETVTTLRGHKRYWPKGKVTFAQLKARPAGEESENLFEQDDAGNWRVKATSSQHTQMRPVNAGVSFEFKVRFENLTNEELGALAWALSMSEDGHHAHSIGMGKPFGMGAVHLTASLTLTKRNERYARLFAEKEGDGKTLQTGATSADKNSYVQLFKTHIFNSLEHEDKMDSDESIASDFDSLPRIRRLMKLAAWQENMSDATLSRREYMPLEKFKRRPVLPDPLDIDGDVQGELPRQQQRNIQQPAPATRDEQPQQPVQTYYGQARQARPPQTSIERPDEPAQPAPTPTRPPAKEEKAIATLAQAKKPGSQRGQLKIKYGEKDVQLAFDGFVSFDQKPTGTQCLVVITRNKEGKPNKVLRFIDWK